jgi:hypothetical protein
MAEIGQLETTAVFDGPLQIFLLPAIFSFHFSPAAI